MIVADTDFLSAFSKIGKIDLIFKVFKTKENLKGKDFYEFELKVKEELMKNSNNPD